MEKGEFVERRKFPRVDIIFKVQYHVQPNFEKKELEGVGKDVSLGGASFEINEEIPAGTVVSLRFSLAGVEGEIKAMGRVVRVWKEKETEKFLCAVEFTAIDPFDYDILISIIDEYMKLKKSQFLDFPG